MKNLIIIGARGFGREVYDLALNSVAFENGDFEIKGFLDDKEDALTPFKNYPPIISSVEAYVPQENDVFTCALGSVEHKKKYAEMILVKGGKFVNLIDKTAQVKSDVSSSVGLLIFAMTFISVDVRIEDFVTIQNHSTMGHDAYAGKWSHISAYCSLTGYSVIEEEVMLQTGARIVPKKKVGKGAMVGASSLVIKNVKPGTKVFGIPARPI